MKMAKIEKTRKKKTKKSEIYSPASQAKNKQLGQFYFII